jgi:hypothetical protein
MTAAALARSAAEVALESLRREGNPFRNYFARNPDDEVCARFHVPELFSLEREQLLAIVDLYRATPATHSEMVPILGNKGSGKTHLLHSIKHGTGGAFQVLVTPGSFPKDTDFLEYLVFQVIDTLLGGGKQQGRRPLDLVQDELTRMMLKKALTTATKDELLDLFPAPGLGKWTRKIGLGTSQAQERTQWLLDGVTKPTGPGGQFVPLKRLLAESSVEPEKACELIGKIVDRTETHDTLGQMRRALAQGFARGALIGDEAELANFLTYGFAELDFKVQPSRMDLVRSLFKVVMGILHDVKIPVVVAFDQLEDLLLARRADDGQRMAEAFFAGIVQAMHQIDGLCILVFAERGLWNRFIPTLDGYIQDRLTNPVHVPGHGSLKAIRLEAPPLDLVRKIVMARLAPVLEGIDGVSPLYPFTEDQVVQIAKTEPTLRDMLQQFRYLFDSMVFGEKSSEATTPAAAPRIAEPKVEIKSVVTIQQPTNPTETTKVTTQTPAPATRSAEKADLTALTESWNHEMRCSLEKLSPDGALTGATRELQLGLGALLRTCHEHGVKVGPWRLQHVVNEFAFGEHPTYGIITIAHWNTRDGQPWKVGIGLFLARGAGKPRDMETKLGALKLDPPAIDHLILLRPDDDASLTGKSKTLWQAAEKAGMRARIEAMSIENYAILYGFPRWLAAVNESLPNGQALPNLADLLQEKCERLLEQICMPTSA